MAERIARGRLLAELLQRRVTCPAAQVVPHSYWAFPIVVDEPGAVISALARAGFDCTQGHNLYAATAPTDRPELDPSATRETLSKMIYLPCYPEIPSRALRRMADVLLQHCGNSGAG